MNARAFMCTIVVLVTTSADGPLAAGGTAPVAVKRSFLLGIVDDSSDLSRPEHRAAFARASLTAVRGVVHWQPGRQASTVQFDRPPRGVRPVLSVLASARWAPVSDGARGEYCDFVTEVLRSRPWLRDVIIWNEPGTRSYFWPRYFHEDEPIPAYVRLLARCYDQLHAAYPGVRVIAPAAHVPLPEMRLLVHTMAQFARDRRRPVLDVFALHPYGLTAQTRHVLELLDSAFARTPQRVPPVWYTEHGIESRPAEHKRDLYDGDSPRGVTEAEQALFVKHHVRAAYCTPGIEAYFNFLLRDEANLGWSGESAGFQTGLLYPDWTPKPAFTTMRSMATQIRNGTVAC